MLVSLLFCISCEASVFTKHHSLGKTKALNLGSGQSPVSRRLLFTNLWVFNPAGKTVQFCRRKCSTCPVRVFMQTAVCNLFLLEPFCHFQIQQQNQEADNLKWEQLRQSGKTLNYLERNFSSPALPHDPDRQEWR